MRQVTINDIASRAGVSKGAVSYALNDKPGVSAKTRARILAIADEMGWAPDRTARMLSGSRTDTLGMVLARPARILANEPFHMEFIAGLESVLAERNYALLLQVVRDRATEQQTYRRWASERRVDAVVVVDIDLGDTRLPLLASLPLPAVLIGDPSVADGFTTVYSDDTAAMTEAVNHLVGLGHVSIARVAGPAQHVHTRIRDVAFDLAVAEGAAAGRTMYTDYTADAGTAAMRTLLQSASPPTAIVFDNDLMAVASLSALAAMGVDVPGDVSLLAWDDSALCEVTHPRLSAMSHDVMAYGAEVARRTFGLLGGEPAAAHLGTTPRLMERASTGPPPRRAGRRLSSVPSSA